MRATRLSSCPSVDSSEAEASLSNDSSKTLNYGSMDLTSDVTARLAMILTQVEHPTSNDPYPPTSNDPYPG